jgi:hypothetical protein
MILKSQVIPMILERCPAFTQAWKKHRKYWADKEAGIYNDLAEFAHFIVDSYSSGNTSSIAAAFTVIEEFLVDGDQEVRTAAEIGFLEDIQNIASWHPFGSGVFIQWLGPQSKMAWASVEETWRGKSSLADVIRGEQSADKKR